MNLRFEEEQKKERRIRLIKESLRFLAAVVLVILLAWIIVHFALKRVAVIGSAKPAKPPAPSPPELINQSKGIKPSTAIGICVALVLCLLLILFCGVRKYRQTNAVRQAYIDEVKAVCLAYGFDTVQVTFSVSEDESLLLYYPDITVNGLSGLTLPDQYALVKALDDLEIGRVNKTSITMPTVHCDGKKV